MVARHLLIASAFLAAFLAVAANAAALAQSAAGLTLPNQAEIPVSPATPGSVLSNETTGSNPLTGLPCTGAGALAVSGAGGLSDSASAPPDSDSSSPQLPTVSSVFGSSTSLGSC
jgi:hypothetical protein